MRRVGVVLLLAVLAGGTWWSLRASHGRSEAEHGLPGRDLAEQALGLYRRGEHDASAELYRQAAEAAQSADDGEAARGYLAQSGVSLKMAGRAGEARVVMLRALTESQQAGDRHTEGLALGNLARIESIDGHLDRAVEYLDRLVEFAREEQDGRLEVQTLEQCSAGALQLADPTRALRYLEQALTIDETLSPAERRHDALLAQKANALAELGDDEGAHDLWQSLPQSPAVLANRARHLSRLGQHAQAADLAFDAAQGFGAEGAGRQDERDRALALHLSELIDARELEACASRLAQVFESSSDELALAPFRVQRGRLALAQNRPADALDDLRRAAAALSGTPAGIEVRLLLALALSDADQGQAALEVLADLPDSLAQSFLRARVLVRDPPETSMLAENLPLLSGSRYDASDTTLEDLRKLSPQPLPSLAYLVFEMGLVDSRRLQDREVGPLADTVFDTAAREALRWQAIEAMRRVKGLRPDDAALAEQGRTIDAWVGGQLADDEAVIVVLPGEVSSYLLLCTRALGVTSFSLPGATQLAVKAGAVVATLHGAETGAVASAAFDLYSALFPARAQQDLRSTRRWTLILPDEVTSVPPAVLVSRLPSAGAAMAWLVRDHELLLLPHALAAGPAPAAPGERWLSLVSPEIDRARIPLVAACWLATYGESVFGAETTEPFPGGVAASDKAATIGLLRRLLPGAQGLQLSVPGAGGGRLGGLLFAPQDDLPSGDERAGFLPWHRLTELPLPPDVILDDTRFLPGDTEHGPAYAATAVLSRSGHLLMTRWPLLPALRVGMLAEIQARHAQGTSLARSLAAVQRDMLLRAEQAGESAAQHPRVWGAWLPYGAD